MAPAAPLMQLPLFPLETVLCPGIALPLHVFEPRYRRLTEHCLETNQPFGVVLIRQGREVGGGDLAISGIGTMAEIRSAERQPDGRYELLVVGGARFEVRDVDADSEPYLVADVKPLDEIMGNLEHADELADRVMRRFVTYLRLLRPQTGESVPTIGVQVEVEGLADSAGAGDLGSSGLRIPDDPSTLSHLFSGIVLVDSLRRQSLLEADTAEDRLAELDRLLATEILLLGLRLRPLLVGRERDALRGN